MLKVLLITTSFPQKDNPHSGFFIEQLVKSFPADVQVTVITPADKHQSGFVKKEKYRQVNFAYGPRNWRNIAHSSGGLVEALNRKKAAIFLIPALFLVEFITILRWAGGNDVIHANWSINGVIAGLAGRIKKVPVITTLRGSDVNKSEQSIIIRSIISICLKLSNEVVTVSESLRNKLIGQFPMMKKSIYVIENGVEDLFLHLPIKHNKNKRGISVLLVGNLTKNKGVDVFINAINHLPLENLSVDIVGDGPEMNSLKQMCNNRGLADYIHFHGRIDPSKRISLYETADIFVFTSFSEGRSNVILEAMASGLAIVASDIDGTNEIISNEKQGLLFQPGNCEELAQKIKILLDDPEMRRDLGKRARQKILESNLTWYHAAKQYHDLYCTILK